MAIFQLIVENHTDADRHVVLFGSAKKLKRITMSDPGEIEITGIGASYKQMLAFFEKHVYKVTQVEVKATRVENVPPPPAYHVHSEDLNKNYTSIPLNTKDNSAELIRYYSWKKKVEFLIDSLTSIDFNMPPNYKIEVFIDYEQINSERHLPIQNIV